MSRELSVWEQMNIKHIVTCRTDTKWGIKEDSKIYNVFIFKQSSEVIKVGFNV